MLRIESVYKNYNQGFTNIKALQNVNLEVNTGEFVTCIGKSGCGKSTLLNLIGGLDRPTKGEIIFKNQYLARFNSNQLAEYRKKSVGMIFQSFNLIPTQYALENITTALAIGGVSRNERKEKGMQLLEKVGLADRAYHFPNQLSGGESQRLGIARALANNPTILLADEPTGNLDSETAEHIYHLLITLNNEKKTIIMVTHDTENAHRFSNRVLTLKDGQIIHESKAC